MPNHHPTDLPPVVIDHAQRAEQSLMELNTRIAVLAHVLGADLGSESDIEHILNRENMFFRLHNHADASLSASDRRASREWEELRGLLVLRCDLMAESIQELGLDATRKIALDVEARREREGLKPDSDGFHLRYHLTLSPSAHDNGDTT